MDSPLSCPLCVWPPYNRNHTTGDADSRGIELMDHPDALITDN
jgi:hypothetical protein